MFGGLSGDSCRTWILIVGFASAVISTVIANSQRSDYINRRWDFCNSQTSCHECIQTPECAWCFSPRLENPRCFAPAETRSVACPEEYIWNPDNVFIMKRNNVLTRINSSSTDRRRSETVQIAPQEIDLKLRVHQRLNVSFSYIRADDFPVDVYFAANFKQPIQTADNNLIKLGESLAESISHITSDYRLGFGKTVPSENESGKLYGFKNVVSLSSDTVNFVNAARNSTVANHSDTAKAGYDEILQKILSFELINWRPYARKIIILATDAIFSSAAMEAILKNSTVSEIKYLAERDALTIILVTPEEQFDNFMTLSNSVPGSLTAKLSSNSANVVDMIKSSYASISYSVEIKDTSSRNLRIKYFSNCLTEGAVYETNECSGLKVGSHVQFFAEIGVTECPSYKSQWNQEFVIHPVGIFDRVLINLQLLCGCDCEDPSHRSYQIQSPECNYGGTLKCGACECDEDHFGKRCECRSQDNSYMIQYPCRSDNTSLVDCSGRGSCLCGHCECEQRANPNEIISGRYCECDNFSCDRGNSLLCSGHGACQCGRCVCEKHWTGSACDVEQ